MSSIAEPSAGKEAATPRACPIASALDLVGERWSLLVLRELSLGVHRFSDIQRYTGAPRETLAARLRHLEEAKLVYRRRYEEHPPRDEYHFTQAGAAIQPVLDALWTWGDDYARR